MLSSFVPSGVLSSILASNPKLLPFFFKFCFKLWYLNLIKKRNFLVCPLADVALAVHLLSSHQWSVCALARVSKVISDGRVNIFVKKNLHIFYLILFFKEKVLAYVIQCFTMADCTGNGNLQGKCIFKNLKSVVFNDKLRNTELGPYF